MREGLTRQLRTHRTAQPIRCIHCNGQGGSVLVRRADMHRNEAALMDSSYFKLHTENDRQTTNFRGDSPRTSETKAFPEIMQRIWHAGFSFSPVELISGDPPSGKLLRDPRIDRLSLFGKRSDDVGRSASDNNKDPLQRRMIFLGTGSAA